MLELDGLFRSSCALGNRLDLDTPHFLTLFPRPFCGFLKKLVKKVFNENTKLLNSDFPIWEINETYWTKKTILIGKN